MLLIKVKAVGAKRDEAARLAETFRGRILEATDTTYTIELTEVAEKLDAFILALNHANILEVVRSGAMGIARGEKALRA
jgi:acetolactate synthase-1/3 small subunit